MINRRRFLQGAAALFCAPAILKAESLMRVAPPPGTRLMGGLYVYDWVDPERENLEDMIYDVYPAETPLVDQIQRQAAARDREIERDLQRALLGRIA